MNAWQSTFIDHPRPIIYWRSGRAYFSPPVSVTGSNFYFLELVQTDIHAVLDDHALGGLGDSTAGIPGHAGTGDAVIGEGVGQNLYLPGAGYSGRSDPGARAVGHGGLREGNH